MSNILERLRQEACSPSSHGALTYTKPSDKQVMEEFARTGVAFKADPPVLEQVHQHAVTKLLDCIVPNERGELVLQEGGIYAGCWLESTGTINAELLSRFAPSVSQSTYQQFAVGQREDGLLPYKVTKDGAIFKQIQLVTPLARSVWNHYKLNGKDKAFLTQMYHALSAYDQWLADYRDTRGTGCVEAFCTFDTGHDLSPRFWHIPDTPHQNDPKRYDPNSPLLPLLAPDLTASVYCGRKYLARMAEELGEDPAPWEAKAAATKQALMTHCLDVNDQFFYDIDRHGGQVRIQSDVLLRVLACEAVDDDFFADALKRYLLNTRKFFARYPLTSIAMDDPRFDPSSDYNTWAGATNFLSIIRTPHAFEHHHRYVELTWLMQPILSAMGRMERFSQCLSPWTGAEGFTETYSPAILGVLDYIERLCGILPKGEDTLWFTGLMPYGMDHGQSLAETTAYSRRVEDSLYELHNTSTLCEIYQNGQLLYQFPAGVRVVTDREGQLQGLIGMTIQPVEGELWFDGRELPFRIEGNQRLRYEAGGFVSEANPGMIAPTHT